MKIAFKMLDVCDECGESQNLNFGTCVFDSSKNWLLCDSCSKKPFYELENCKRKYNKNVKKFDPSRLYSEGTEIFKNLQNLENNLTYKREGAMK